jgi:hypothetical protein
MSLAMINLPADVVEHLIANCPGRTDEALQPRFGISYNTWRQIERGAALRRSVAERLITRVAVERAVNSHG